MGMACLGAVKSWIAQGADFLCLLTLDSENPLACAAGKLLPHRNILGFCNAPQT
jgi:hypothetical protein